MRPCLKQTINMEEESLFSHECEIQFEDKGILCPTWPKFYKLLHSVLLSREVKLDLEYESSGADSKSHSHSFISSLASYPLRPPDDRRK